MSSEETSVNGNLISNLRRSESSLVEKAAMTRHSTLVETVSINYEDFTEGFLTCSTCLCTYDGSDHCPKLLHCSHTVCRSCLEKIASLPGVRESGSFRCPICREIIPLPRGGVVTLPPSFLVNQLLDLMARQRREIIPKCSIHNQQELLFCETCDVVFCNVCTNGQHVSGQGAAKNSPTKNSPNHKSSEHTVITFSIAIKRMSEILLYKGHQCINKLDEAHDNVQAEMRKLDQNSASAFEDINRTFQEIINVVDRRRQELLGCAKKIREDKRSVLEDQLKLIESEKEKVETEMDTLQFQVESQVKNITRKINDLGEKIDSVSTLLEPKENCFIRYEHLHNMVESIQTSLNEFGSIRTSRTFPSLCEASVSGKCCAFLQSTAIITTFDYNGLPQRFGGDPVAADLRHSDGTVVSVRITDLRDGKYEAHFTVPKAGTYSLRVAIFGRPIKTFPVTFEASDNINPLCIYGAKGNDLHQFNQPVGLTVSPKDGRVYILDTGNARIKVLDQSHTNNSPFSFVSHIEAVHGLENRSSTGIVLSSDYSSLFFSNWRNKNITEMSLEGEFIRQFGHQEFVEPTYMAVNSKGEILVADNGCKSIFVFHPSGKLRIQIKSQAPASIAPGHSRKSSSASVASFKSATLPASMSQTIKGSPLPSMLLPSPLVTSSITSHVLSNKEPSFSVIGALAVGPNDDILVADSVIQVLASYSGNLIREIFAEGRNKGNYGGVAADLRGHLLATRIEKTRSFVQVFDYSSGQLKFVINSSEARLRRPTSLATTNDDHAIVVDLGNDCIKKYRYF